MKPSWHTNAETVLVTGGTGFIGCRLVRSLLARGKTVRVFSRNEGALPQHGGIRAEFVPGDIRDATAVRHSMKGVAQVAHLAACVSGWGADPAVLQDINVRGTRVVLEEARRAGVQRLVHVSSGSAITVRGSGLLDERSIVPRPSDTDYGRSKHIAELEVLEAESKGLHTVIVYPTRVFGTGTLAHQNAAAGVLDLYLRGRLFVLPRGGKVWANWAFVDDVAEGIALALESGRSGARYLIGGENATLRHFLSLGDAAAGTRHRILPVPYAVGRAVVSAEELRARLAGSTPRLTVPWYDLILENQTLSSARAVSDLGYRITPLRDAVAVVVGWLLGPGRGDTLSAEPERPAAGEYSS